MAAPSSIDTLVGRFDELAALRSVIANHGAALVVGEPGIGKSTLIHAAVQGEEARVGGGLGLLGSIPYLPIARALGPLPDGDPALVASHVVARVGPDGILVLDDLHWADEATIGVIERLVGRITLIGGLRTGDIASDGTQATLVAAGMSAIHLGPLDDEDAAAIVRRLHPDRGASSMRTVVQEAAGNPLLIEELAHSGVTTSLRLSIAHRLRKLPDPAREWLELLAVAGEPLPAPADPGLVDALVRAGFATRSGAMAEIRHAVIADIVSEGLADDRRRTAHRIVAGIVGDPAAVARHLAAAGDRAAAFEIATRAAEISPPGLRVALLGLAAECADGPTAIELRLEAADALAGAGLAATAERLLAMDAPTDDADGARRHLIRTGTRWSLADGDGALAEAEAGLRIVGGTGTPLEARLMVEQAWIATLRREGRRAVDLARAALEATRARGLPQGPAQRVFATALSTIGAPIAEWGYLLEAARDDASRRDDVAEELLCGKILVASQEGSGNAAEGRRLGEIFVKRARDTGMITWEQSIRASLISLANAAGDYRQVVDDAETLLTEPLDRRVRAQTAGYMALALVDLGRFEDARATIDAGLDGSADDVDGRFDLVWARAELALATGDAVRAEAHASSCLERFGEAAYGDLLFVRLVRAWARFDLGRDPGPPIDPRFPTHPVRRGVAPESAGIVSLAAGLPDEAARSFAAAAATFAPYHRRSELRCRWAEGEALRRAGRRDEAVVILEAAEIQAEALGMTPLTGRLRRSLRLAGSLRSAPRERSGALTVREREVLRLVGLGLTNIEIARRMGVGRPTVARILSNAMAKLGVDSRAQAVVHAADLG